MPPNISGTVIRILIAFLLVLLGAAFLALRGERFSAEPASPEGLSQMEHELPSGELAAARAVPEAVGPLGEQAAYLEALLDRDPRVEVQVLGQGASGEWIPLEGVRVLTALGGKAPESIGETSASGLASFTPGVAGRYRITADLETIPQGYCAPGEYATWGERLGLTPVDAVVGGAGGGDVLSTVHLLPARKISGVISAGEYSIVDKLSVTLMASRTGLEGVQMTAELSPLGAFEFYPVPPLEYVVRVVPRWGRSVRALRSEGVNSWPRPRFVDVRDEHSAYVEFAIDRQPGAARGRIVSRQGEPVPGVDIIAYYSRGDGGDSPAHYRFTWNDIAGRATSGAAGEFFVDGLAQGAVKVQVGAEAASTQGPGGQILSGFPSVLELHVGSAVGAVLDVGDVVVDLANLFTVVGRVQLLGGGVDESTVSVAANLAGTAETDGLDRPSLRAGEEPGDYVITCSTPAPDLVIKVSWADIEGVKHRKEFRYSPSSGRREDGQLFTIP